MREWLEKDYARWLVVVCALALAVFIAWVPQYLNLRHTRQAQDRDRHEACIRAAADSRSLRADSKLRTESAKLSLQYVAALKKLEAQAADPAVRKFIELDADLRTKQAALSVANANLNKSLVASVATVSGCN